MAACLAALFLSACSSQSREVVVYVAHDRVLSEPILQQFEARSGIRVRAVYDIEANKTVGLTNRLIAEAPAPRADVFWNNEVIQTVRLQARGVAGVHPLPTSAAGARKIADREARWVGFAARARVILLNTQVAPDYVQEGVAVPGLHDLARPEWRGRVAVANPRFGTTGTHFAALLATWGEPRFREWLRALRANDVTVLPGNAQVRDHVVHGRAAIGLTDTDDAVEAVREGAPVRIVFPDQGAQQQGTLLIPNTVAIVSGAPHEAAAAELVSFLLSRDVEAALAAGRGAQIPINHAAGAPRNLPPPDQIRAMPVDFAAVAASYEPMLSIVEQEWQPRRAQTVE